MYRPDFPPLPHPATADDVKAGKAIFHLDGQGKLADVPLPAVGIWKKTAKEREPRRGLILQAELGPDGEILYGVIERNAIRTVPASDFATVTPLAKTPPRKDCRSFDRTRPAVAHSSGELPVALGPANGLREPNWC
jgi:hypothetical protein